MKKQEFMDYIRENFNVDGATQRLINNILNFVELQDIEKDEQFEVLSELLENTIGLEDDEIKRFVYGNY